jgi:hypothetical protein
VGAGGGPCFSERERERERARERERERARERDRMCKLLDEDSLSTNMKRNTEAALKIKAVDRVCLSKKVRSEG